MSARGVGPEEAGRAQGWWEGVGRIPSDCGQQGQWEPGRHGFPSSATGNSGTVPPDLRAKPRHHWGHVEFEVILIFPGRQTPYD